MKWVAKSDVRLGKWYEVSRSGPQMELHILFGLERIDSAKLHEMSIESEKEDLILRDSSVIFPHLDSTQFS